MINKTEKQVFAKTELNPILLKSFDCIMQQQTKMDHKAYIFIGFLVIIFNALHKESMIFMSTDLILCFIAFPLVISLFPIATKFGVDIVKAFKKVELHKTHNIFYYIDICCLEKDDFISIIKNEYDIENTTKSDERLIEQIIINAEILSRKVFCHTISQYILLFSIVYIIAKAIIG